MIYLHIMKYNVEVMRMFINFLSQAIIGVRVHTKWKFVSRTIVARG